MATWATALTPPGAPTCLKVLRDAVGRRLAQPSKGWTPRGDGVGSPGPPAGYWPEDMPEGMPVITYEPLSDDESSDDEEMREILRKYDIGETR